jgi:hypothetical protein
MIMNRFIKLLAAWSTLALLALPIIAPAHHSTAEYDETVLKEYEGKVVKIFWKNPHVIFHVATMENGKEVVWTLEGASVSTQTRRGMTPDSLKVGDQIRFAGHVSKRRANDMLVQHVLTPGGKELLLRGNATQRWPQSSLVSLKEGIDPAKAAKAKADGLFRVWSWGRLERGWWFFGDGQTFPLTKAALDKKAKWDEYKDNPQLQCRAPGMPATMGNPYPIEFVRVGKNIEMRAEEFDVKRTIYLDGNTGAKVAPSDMGFSVGRWESPTTLVVNTSKITYPYFNRVGASQSKAVTTVERFTIDDANGKLNYELTVTDPWALTKPFTWKGLWVWKPGEEVSVYGCTVEKN